MNFLASFLQALKPRYDDDVVDRLNYYYTTLIILLLAITISAKQYVGQPIQCWVPAQFTGAWEQYAENYCFVQNTYWTAIHDPIPDDLGQREDREIGYYQWVPFILAIEALLFYVPCVMWRVLNFQSEISVQSVVKMASDTENISTEHRNKAVKTISRHIEEAITLQHDLSQLESTFYQMVHCGKAKGIYITSLYLLVKACYVVNVMGQFFLLNAFLGPKSYFWGVEILHDLFNGFEWEESGHFPRVTLCDFEVRVIGNLHRYTIQCVLMINMFNEKIFLFLWWWFLLVVVANIFSFFHWIYIIVPYQKKESFVRRYLLVSGPDQTSSFSKDPRDVWRFINYGLRPDGVFMLRLIAINAGDIITTEIMDELWKVFLESMKFNSSYRGNVHPKPYLNNPRGAKHLDKSSGTKLLVDLPPKDVLDNVGFVETLYTSPPLEKETVAEKSYQV